MRYRRRVVILYRFLPQYRKRFYELLRKKLAESGVELLLVYGAGDIRDRQKGDLIDLPWAHFVPNRIVRVLGNDLYWQPVTNYIRGADLIIVEQASKLLINYYLQIRQAAGLSKVAFWGHGRNFQASPKNKVAEAIKRVLSKYVHWWFAYNDKSKKVVESLGYPSARITSVQNAIDTNTLRQAFAHIDNDEKKKIRQRFGLNSNNICVFCGGMYKEKRLDFLFEAARQVKDQIGDFELVLIGSGSDRYLAKEMALKYGWIHYLGPRFDRDKVEIFSISKLLLMPGLVGLAVLDSFALGVPLITTDVPFHSPEIAYLKTEVNGIITDNDLEQYAGAVVSLLRDTIRLDQLRVNALASAERYTIENMVDNFHQGVLLALRDT